jgi:hypothetical protein
MEKGVMGPSRKRKTTVRVSARRYPFVVEILVPEGGFGLRLDAINAWHRYTKNKQRRVHPHPLKERKFGRWRFESLAVAERFSERFGGQILAVVAEVPDGRMAATGSVRKVVCATGDRQLPDRV